jgi:predicted Zn-dependent protease
VERSIDLLKRVVRESSADQTEVLLLTEDSSLTRFAQSTIHQHVAERNETAILRVVSNKRIAVVTTNILKASSLRNSLKKAISLAQVQQPNEEFKSLPEPRPIPDVDTFSEKIDRLTPEKKVKTMRNLFSIAKGKGFKASGAFSQGKVELAVVNSLGVEAYQLYSDVFFHLVVANGKSSGYGSFVSRDPDQLNIESLAEEAARRASGGEPIQIEPGEYEVILEPYAVSELLSFLGYLGFHALAVQEGGVSSVIQWVRKW